MESNETILNRSAIAFKERRNVGKVSGVRIDYENMVVSHYVISNGSTGNQLVLPFNKSIGLGDTFLTVKSRNDFLPIGESSKEVLDGFKLVGIEAYSRGGNLLGTVEGFEFDPVTGKIQSISLGRKERFGIDAVLFLSPEFVFVDDGEPALLDLRATIGQTDDDDEDDTDANTDAIDAVDDVTIADTTTNTDDTAADTADDDEDIDEDVAKAVAAELSKKEPAVATAENELHSFLLGKKLIEAVKTSDGEVSFAKGTVVTQEIFDQAQEHDALMLLTMAVEI